MATPQELRAALRAARPGTIIELQPGTYELSGPSLLADRAGQLGRPIIVRAEQFGTVRLKFSILEGFHVVAPYWTFENLVIDAICPIDTNCEHAFHVVGGGSGVVIRNNWVTHFPAGSASSEKPGHPHLNV